MKILALDTSSRYASVAITQEESLLSEASLLAPASHGERIVQAMQAALDLAGMRLEDIETIAVGLGPGSFTGLRVGLSTAKGLAVARGLPVVGVPTLPVLAAGAPAQEQEIVLPVLDAHKSEVLVGGYRASEPQLREVLATFSGSIQAVGTEVRRQLGDAPLVLLGEGLRKHGEAMFQSIGAPHRVLADLFDRPRAELVAQAGARLIAAHGPTPAAELEPLYVRPADVTPS